MIEIENVKSRYGARREWALDGVTLRVERGCVAGLVGPNGSGKTTLYRLILGLLRPEAGRVRVCGLDPAVYRRRVGIGYLPEQVRLPGTLRVRELAELVGALARLSSSHARMAADHLIAELELEAKIDVAIGKLSHGYRQRVGLLAALLGDPQLLLLDEPANGLDPLSIGILRTVLRRLRRDGRTVMLSSHNLFELERLCDTVIIIRDGQLLGRVTRDELASRPNVWVVRLDPEHVARRPMPAFTGEGGVRLAGDEVAFGDEFAARRFASRMSASGITVETIEPRQHGLEFLFHALLQERTQLERDES